MHTCICQATRRSEILQKYGGEPKKEEKRRKRQAGREEITPTNYNLRTLNHQNTYLG